MALRTCIIFLALSVLVGGGVGTANGLVLYIDCDGHLAVDAPHLRHAHSHQQGADHPPHDHDHDADHGDLHRLISTCCDVHITVQKVEKPSTAPAAAWYDGVADAFNLPVWSVPGVEPSPSDGVGAPSFRGSTAHPELAALRSVVLLV